MTYEFQPVHALQSVLGAAAERRRNHLAVHRAVAVAAVLAAPGREAEAAGILVTDGTLQVRFSAPGEWLALSAADAPDALLAELRQRLGDFAFVVDQSEGRAVFTLSGPDVRRILANGVAVDLHPEAFPVGRAANALCGHITVNLARTHEDVFELVVARSFAEALFEDLKIIARGHELSAGFAALS